MSYERVIDTLHENGLEFTEVDRILLDEDSYQDLVERTDGARISSYRTMDAPAVRVTQGQEKIVYVDDNGLEVELEL